MASALPMPAREPTVRRPPRSSTSPPTFIVALAVSPFQMATPKFTNGSAPKFAMPQSPTPARSRSTSQPAIPGSPPAGWPKTPPSVAEIQLALNFRGTRLVRAIQFLLGEHTRPRRLVRIPLGEHTRPRVLQPAPSPVGFLFLRLTKHPRCPPSFRDSKGPPSRASYPQRLRLYPFTPTPSHSLRHLTSPRLPPPQISAS